MAGPLDNQIMGTIDLSFLPALAAAKQMGTTLEQLNAQLRMTQATAKQTGAVFMQDMARQVQQTGIILDRHGKILYDANAKPTKSIKDVTSALKEQEETIGSLSKHETFLQRRVGWFLAGTAFYGSIKAVKETVAAIKDVEMGMIEIARITDDVTFKFSEMRTELLQLGIDYGRSWDEVQNVALKWAQAGYNINDILVLTKSSLVALNTAELDAQNATQSMIGILSQWGLEAKDLLGVIDKINKTADDFPITSQDLVDGLLRSSGAARILNMSLEDTISVLTVMKEATGRTGREIGNALNSILSYMQRPSAIKAFESLGISMFADEARTQFRPVMQTLAELSERWGTASEEIRDGFVAAAQEAGLFSEELAIATGAQEEYIEMTQKAAEAQAQFTDIERRDAAQAAAGVFRRNYLIALLERFTHTQDVLNNMMDAEGYSMRENANTMEALEMKVQALKTAFTMLAVEIGEAGLLNIMKGAVDTTRKLVEGFEQLPKPLKEFILTMGVAAVALGALGVVAKTLYLTDMVKGIHAYIIELQAATVATGGLTVATGGLSAAFYAMPIAGQIALLVSLCATIYMVSESFEDATEKSKEMMRQNLAASDKAKKLADEIERLAKQYEHLAKKEEDSADKSDEFKRVTRELTDLVPTAIVGFDEMGAAITDIGTASEEAAKKVAELRQEVARSAEANAAIAQKTLPLLQKDLENAEKRRDLIKELFEAENYRAILGGGAATGASEMDRWKWFTMFGDSPEWITRSTALYEKARADYEEAYRAVREAESAINFQEVLSSKTTAATPTAGGMLKENPAQALERLTAERENLTHQLKTGAISEGKYLSALRDIEKQMRAAGIEERKIWSIQEEIYSLAGKGKFATEIIRERQTYYQHLLKMEQISTEEYIIALEELEEQLIAVGAKEEDLWSLQSEIFTLRKQEAKKVYDTMYSDSMDFYRHETALARMSAETQIRYIQDLAQRHEWSIEKRRQLELESFNLYKSELSKQQATIEEAYRERIDLIDKETEALTKALQTRIDTLDKEDEGQKREESERQHNKTIEELREKLQYHQLRTGAEHAKAIIETEQRIEEENRRWQQQLDDWERDDKKKSLQQQIKDIKEAAEEEKKVWKQKYDEIKARWDEWAVNFAQAAINDPQWLNIGKSIGQQIADGFSGSIWQMESVLASVGDSVPVNSSGSASGGGTKTFRDSDGNMYVKNADGSVTKIYSEKWGGQYGTGTIVYPGDPRWQYLPSEITSLDKGGRIKEIGWALVHPEERVLTPALTDKFDNLVAALRGAQSSSTQTHTDNRKSVHIDAIFRSDKTYINDPLDANLFGRELGRGIQTVTGGM